MNSTLYSIKMAPSKPYDVGIRIQCLAYLELGVPINTIATMLHVEKPSIYRFRRIAKERGYDPEKSKAILLRYLMDAPRSGRPTVCIPEVINKVITNVTANVEGRASSCSTIGARVGISGSTAWRLLKSQGFRNVKRTMKPGLTTAMKEARLQFALRFEHWTLEDWKNVIWSDETSVILGHRRGGIRVWRKSAEKYDKTCMTRRWKGSSEFMFWGCFSYNKKGPFHI